MLCLTNDKKLKHEKFFEKRSTKLKSLSLLEFTRKKIGGSRVSKRIALFRGMIWRFGERGARVLAWSCHLVDYPGHVIRHPRRGFEKKPKGMGKEKKKERNGKKEERKEESGPINTQTRGGCQSIFTFVPGNHGGVCRLPCGGCGSFWGGSFGWVNVRTFVFLSS